MSGIGEPSGWSPLLEDLKSRLDALLDEEDPLDAEFTEEEEGARAQAARNFRESTAEILAQATPYLWDYYRAMVAAFSPADRALYGVPDLPPDTDIWTQVSITGPPYIRPGGTTRSPAAAYVSFEGQVSWEAEHGLELVFEDGLRVCKVGPYDGFSTHAGASGDVSLLGVVFRL